MTVKKQADGRYLAQVFPHGRGGKRIRKLFKTKNEAVLFERHTLNEANSKPWMPTKDDDRTLDDLIDLWFSLHGQALSDGAKRTRKLKATSELMGNPIARRVTAQDFSRYRVLRLKSVSIKTVNNEQTYLNALFNELRRLGEWTYDNPLTDLRALKYQQPEMGFLQDEQIPILLDALTGSPNPDVYLVAKICISTGCRWGEAESLTQPQLTPHRLTFIRTKGNKRRTVPISKELYDELPTGEGRLFSDCRRVFDTILTNTKLDIPKGQSTHVLRHTFASHFMMKGGNILVLKEILGQASITDTMKYAHFSPSHLEDAVKLNPLKVVSYT